MADRFTLPFGRSATTPRRLGRVSVPMDHKIRQFSYFSRSINYHLLVPVRCVLAHRNGANESEFSKMIMQLFGRIGTVELVPHHAGVIDYLLIRHVFRNRKLERFCPVYQERTIGWYHAAKRIIQFFYMACCCLRYLLETVNALKPLYTVSEY